MTNLAMKLDALPERRALRLSSRVPALLVAPSLLVLIIFFLLPIVGFMLRSVDNSEVSQTLPRTVEALGNWTVDQPIPNQAFEALAKELIVADEVSVSQLARRLNYVMPEFRRLILRTSTELKTTGHTDLKAGVLAASPKWEDPHVWAVIRDAGGTLTPTYFMMALDLTRDDTGGIRFLPSDQRTFIPVIAQTFFIASTITALCLLIGYPVAHLISITRPSVANLLMFFVLLPFWTSILVRTSAWILLLQREGLLNNILLKLGIIDSPIELMFNRFGVYIAMVHVMLPFAVMPLYAAMKKVPKVYVKAAASLGANPVRAFFEVYVPQTYAGVVASSILVFVLTLGYYITPSLVGGPNDQMIGTFIAFYTNVSLNWGLAAALSIILLIITLAIYGIFAAVFGAEKIKLN